MSVKIYDGMMVESDLSLADLGALVGKARPKLDKLVEAAQLAAVALVAVRGHDMALMGIGEPAGELGALTPLAHGLRHLDSERQEDKKGLRTALPMGLEACFMAIGSGKTLMLAYGAEGLKKAFASMAGAREHGYWNNVDEPEGMARAEWAQRRRDWQKALGKDFAMSPSEAGVSVKLVSEKYASWWSPETNAVGERARAGDHGVDKRAAWLAREVCREMFMESSKSYQEFQKEASGGASGFMKAMGEWSEAARGSHKPMIDLATTVLEQALPAIDEAAIRTPMRGLWIQGAAMRAMLSDRLALRPLEAAKVASAPKRGL